MNNLKQLSLANVMYAGDYNGTLLQPDGATSPYGAKAEWIGGLIDYFSKATNMILCPSAKTAVANPAASGISVFSTPGNAAGGGQGGSAENSYVVYLTVNSPVGWTLACSYTYNAWLYSPTVDGVYRDAPGIESQYGVTDPGWCFLKDTQVQNPSLTPLYADGIWQDACPLEVDAPGQDLWRGTDWLNQRIGYQMGRIAVQRHAAGLVSHNYPGNWKNSPPNGAVNVGTIDGHAELSKLPNLWNFTWHRNWGQNPTVSIGTPAPY